MLKGQYTWRAQEKRTVREKLDAFELTTGARFYNPDNTQFGMLQFNKTGVEAGSVWLFVRDISIWDRDKRNAVKAFIQGKFDNPVLQERSVDTTASRDVLKVLFYPNGYPVVLIETQERADLFVNELLYHYRNVTHEFRMTPPTLQGAINEFVNARHEKIACVGQWETTVITLFNERFAAQKAAELARLNKRRILISQADDVWLIRIEPLRYDAPDKTVVNVRTEDIFEAYRTIRQYRDAEMSELSKRMFLKLACSVSDSLLGLDYEKVQQADDAPANSFLND